MIKIVLDEAGQPLELRQNQPQKIEVVHHPQAARHPPGRSSSSAAAPHEYPPDHSTHSRRQRDFHHHPSALSGSIPADSDSDQIPLPGRNQKQAHRRNPVKLDRSGHPAQHPITLDRTRQSPAPSAHAETSACFS
jgi:hypothetical protein